MPLKVEITQLLAAGTGGDLAAIDTPPICDEFRPKASLRRCPQRSGAGREVSLEKSSVILAEPAGDLALAEIRPPKCYAVEPRHFGAAGISPMVVTHGGRLANAWLRCGISGESLHGS